MLRPAIIPIFYLALALSGCRRPAQTATVRTIVTSDKVSVTDVQVPSSAIHQLLSYRAIVPKGDPSERFPVLYFLHGANSDPAEVTRSAPIARYAAEQGLIVILPDGQHSYFTNARHRSNARWEDAITQDLVRDVQSRFRALTEREHTGIVGISMGGYGAVKIALKHPEEYGFAGTLSGALDYAERKQSLASLRQTLRLWRVFGSGADRTAEDVFHLAQNSPALHQTTWFAACGQADTLFDVNFRFAREMRERGANFNIVTTPGGHNWQTWNTDLPLLFERAGATLRPTVARDPTITMPENAAYR
jgi:putative tributyrin esterase